VLSLIIISNSAFSSAEDLGDLHIACKKVSTSEIVDHRVAYCWYVSKVSK